MSLVLSGMSLWGFGKKRKNKEKEKASRAGKAENAAVFPTGSPPPPPSVYDPFESSAFHFNDEPYDPEADYAQVLSEAQQFMARTKVSSLAETTAMPANTKLFRNYSSIPKEPNPSEHAAPLKKSKSSWKNIKESLFRQKSKKNIDGYTPSPSLRPSRKTLNRSVSGPLSSYGGGAASIPKRRGQQGFSGPLYSVGTRPQPTNKFGRSGFRSGSATPERGCHLESPYELLKSSAREIYEPGHLYIA